MRAGRSVTLRMYSVGFGDCLLLTINTNDHPWRMLIDCGVHTQGVGQHSLSEVIDDLLLAAKGDDGQPRLDVVVATHRHRDHIIGFDDERWDAVEVGEVWLPWTENPNDPDAVKLRLEMDQLARSMATRFGQIDDAAFGVAMNSLTNDSAMSTLLRGFAGVPRRRFLRASDRPIEIQDVRGMRAHVLGPPEDMDTLRRMDPPKKQRWFGDGAIVRDTRPPVNPTFALAPDEYAQLYGDLALSPAARKQIAADQENAMEATSWIDRCVNNTSVFLAVEIDDLVILLAGDAQWGPWQRALADSETRDLLRRVAVYKVSHHGSHNGTPIPLVEEHLRDDVISLVSVQPVKAWKHIPKDTLMDALAKPDRQVVRSDDPEVAAPLTRRADGLWIEAAFPSL